MKKINNKFMKILLILYKKEETEEAKLAFLEAAEAQKEYDEKYGEE